MSSVSPSPTEAVIICTRNRPADLQRTLESVAVQQGRSDRLVYVVDASDESERAANKEMLGAVPSIPVQHLSYQHSPSSARQRNYALDRLPESVRFVHFLDDDVILQPLYFTRLVNTLESHPQLGGVGGVIIEDRELLNDTASASLPSAPDPSFRTWMRRAFLLDGSVPGRVLSSGRATSAQSPDACASQLCSTEWLCGCCSVRRNILSQFRFDNMLQGYAMLEDLDLTYRISRRYPLAVNPEARLLHRASPVNRYAAKHYARNHLVHRYWFVLKNLSSPHCRAAFWWSVIGALLAAFASRKAAASAVTRGILLGIRDIVLRRDPLLR